MLDTKILALTLSALIVGVESQVTCTSTSPQCCWAVRSWQLMGQTIPAGIKSTDNSCCTKPMAGITCDSTKTKVTGINWCAKGLKNSIPADIGKLVNLEHFALINNQLTGSIPSSIGNLINLQTIQLNGNRLSGAIPSTIGNLKSLFGLWFFDNLLSGSIPTTIGNLNSLTYLYLNNNNLTGSIPTSIGNLAKLVHLGLPNNQLSGAVPSEFAKLSNLAWTALFNNPNLSGTITPKCGVEIFAINTKINICGCATIGSPAVQFPPSSSPLACLATGTASPLRKRILVFSQNVDGYKVTCNNDANGNPFQDCLNAQAAVCNPSYISGNSTRITNCKNAVDVMTRRMSQAWIDVRIACASWSYYGAAKGALTSLSCTNANNALKVKAYYALPDGSKGYVNSAFIESVNQLLWNNGALK